MGSTSLVYGAFTPLKREAEPSKLGHHSGPHCHDKKDHKCHKKPKQQEHEECHVEYDIVVDVTEIEECEYVVITHCEEEHEQVYHKSHIVDMILKLLDTITVVTMGTVDTTSVLLILATAISVMTRRSNSATNTPRKTLARSPSRLARKLWTPSILRSVRRESTHIVRKHKKDIITALVLLDMTQSLWLMDIMTVMEVAIRSCVEY